MKFRLVKEVLESVEAAQERFDNYTGFEDGDLDEGVDNRELKEDMLDRKQGWFTLDTKNEYFGKSPIYYLCFNPVGSSAIEETITHSKKIYDVIEDGYKYLIQYTPCNKPWKSRTAGVVLSMANIRILDKKQLTNESLNNRELKESVSNSDRIIWLRGLIKADTYEEASPILDNIKFKDKDLFDKLLQLEADGYHPQEAAEIMLGEVAEKEIRGKYNYIGEYDGYKIYEPLDVQASMDLGVNTSWGTAGRYGRYYGHPELTPSLNNAKWHWDNYARQGVRLFYFLNPKTMYGEYAVAVYPGTLEAYKRFGYLYINNINIPNFTIYNAKDDLDYSAINKLPLDKIPNIKIDADEAEIETSPSTVKPIALDLLSKEEAESLPDNIIEYEDEWWLKSPVKKYKNYNLAACVLGNNIYSNFVTQRYAVRPALTISNIESDNLKLYSHHKIFGEDWIYIGDNRFLFNGDVIHHNFDKKSNKYEKSEIKQLLNRWLEKLKRQSVSESYKGNKGMRFKLVESVNELILSDKILPQNQQSASKVEDNITDYLQAMNPGDKLISKTDIETESPGECAEWYFKKYNEDKYEVTRRERVYTGNGRTGYEIQTYQEGVMTLPQVARQIQANKSYELSYFKAGELDGRFLIDLRKSRSRWS